MSAFTIAGIGEVLWDDFPDGERFGGAPANFTCHCCSLGAHAYMISCVGDDRRGEMAMDFLSAHGVDVSGLVRSPARKTGVVLVSLDENGRPSYKIEEDVAWDYLPFTDELATIATTLDAVCFGSLGQRSSAARETIQSFVRATRADCLRIFDINLRQRYYTEEIIRESLAMAKVLKLNDEELDDVKSLYELEGSEETVAKNLLEVCDLKIVVLTRGAKGSLIATRESISTTSGCETDVVDTVGAGDAFTAAMLTGFLNQKPIQDINEHAARVAAYVCSQSGAVPDLPAAFRSPAVS